MNDTNRRDWTDEELNETLDLFWNEDERDWEDDLSEHDEETLNELLRELWRRRRERGDFA